MSWCSTPPTPATDVRDVTGKIAQAARARRRTANKKFAPKVEFGWGTYSFKGVVEQYKETIDFFSADGVPLRASVNLTLASQELTFADPDRREPPSTAT